jgi:hypothetical protein
MQLEIQSNLEGEILLQALENFYDIAREEFADGSGEASPEQEAVTNLQSRMEILLDVNDDDPTFDEISISIPQRLADVGYMDVSPDGEIVQVKTMAGSKDTLEHVQIVSATQEEFITSFGQYPED